MTQEEAHQIIKDTTTQGILNYCKNSLNKERSFQILDLIFPRERKIRSIIGGLETSLGRTLWEPAAKKIALQNNFRVIDADLEAPSIMPQRLGNVITEIISDRSDQHGILTGQTSRQKIIDVCQYFLQHPIENFKKPPRGQGVDVWLVKDGINYFFDTKTVQPNIGDFKKYVLQITNWYAYFYSRNPSSEGFGKMVFPYNPYQGGFWEKSKGKGKPLDPIHEALVGNDFWDFISGLENTFQIFKDVFNELREENTLSDKLQELI